MFGFGRYLYGSYLSFTDYSLVRETHWVGLANYRYIFGNDMFLTGLKTRSYFY